ncbi:hypothetical protein EV361DRAFT_872601 [Lentinula raphanica]|nr:hypothetical protein EV361DRAFT_872601 [Lentinula raphanica]
MTQDPRSHVTNVTCWSEAILGPSCNGRESRDYLTASLHAAYWRVRRTLKKIDSLHRSNSAGAVHRNWKMSFDFFSMGIGHLSFEHHPLNSSFIDGQIQPADFFHAVLAHLLYETVRSKIPPISSPRENPDEAGFLGGDQFLEVSRLFLSQLRIWTAQNALFLILQLPMLAGIDLWTTIFASYVRFLHYFHGIHPREREHRQGEGLTAGGYGQWPLMLLVVSRSNASSVYMLVTLDIIQCDLSLVWNRPVSTILLEVLNKALRDINSIQGVIPDEGILCMSCTFIKFLKYLEHQKRHDGAAMRKKRLTVDIARYRKQGVRVDCVSARMTSNGDGVVHGGKDEPELEGGSSGWKRSYTAILLYAKLFIVGGSRSALDRKRCTGRPCPSGSTLLLTTFYTAPTHTRRGKDHVLSMRLVQIPLTCRSIESRHKVFQNPTVLKKDAHRTPNDLMWVKLWFFGCRPDDAEQGHPVQSGITMRVEDDHRIPTPSHERYVELETRRSLHKIQKKTEKADEFL